MADEASGPDENSLLRSLPWVRLLGGVGVALDARKQTDTLYVVAHSPSGFFGGALFGSFSGS